MCTIPERYDDIPLRTPRLLTALDVFMPVELDGYPPIELGGIGPMPGERIPPAPPIGGGGIICPGVGVIVEEPPG